MAASRARTAAKPAAAHAHPAKCLNCGAPLHGRYCHACGQDAHGHKRSIWHLGWEALEGLFHFDGRLMSTVPALFVHPGRLARDYIEGRIARHVPPFRMFLVALLIFIFAAEYAAHQQTLANERAAKAHEAALATPQGRAVEAARMRKEAVDARAESLKDAAEERDGELKDPDENRAAVAARYAKAQARADQRYAEALDKADRVAKGLPAAEPKPARKDESGWQRGRRIARENPEYYWSVLFGWGHRLAILLLPILGLSLGLMYRRRKDLFLYDHLLVAMQLMSFSFLANAPGFFLPQRLAVGWFGIVALWTPVNLFQTLRGGYGSGVAGAALKALAVWLISVTAFLALVVGLFVFSLWAL